MVMVTQAEVLQCAADPSWAKALQPILSKYPFVKSIAVGNEPDLPGGAPPSGQNLEIFQALPQAVQNVKNSVGNLAVTVPWSNGVLGAKDGDWNDVVILERNVDVVSSCMPHMDFWAFNPYPIFAYTQDPSQAWQNWVLGDGDPSAYQFKSMLESQLSNMRHALMSLDVSGS